jgi:hypothetical protein
MRVGSKLALLLFVWCVAFTAPAQQSQEEVAQKGATVMPFDLALTQHFFDDKPTGGLETVTANDKRDARQIDLIRSHLKAEAERFARGEFSDPGAIHGADMPGLATLAAAGSKLKVAYSDHPAGASIAFTSSDSATVRAIHEWFAAQRSDHGAHARMHH